MGFQEAQQNLFEPEAARSLLDKLLTNSQLYRQSKDYKELLDFVIRLRNFSPFNAMLLQVQKPGLRYAASAYDWLQRFSRTPKEGARPLLILWPFGPVALVYDVMDTEGGCLPSDVAAFAAEGDVDAVRMTAFVELTKKKRIDCCWIDAGDGLAGSIQVVLRAANSKEFTEYRMQINKNHVPAVQFNTLAHELGHLFLGHLGPDKKLKVPERAEMEYPQRELEAESVAYLVCARNGVRSKSEAYLTNHVTTTTAIGDVDVYQVMRAAGQVEALLELAPALLLKGVSAEQAEPSESVEGVAVFPAPVPPAARPNRNSMQGNAPRAPIEDIPPDIEAMLDAEEACGRETPQTSPSSPIGRQRASISELQHKYSSLHGKKRHWIQYKLAPVHGCLPYATFLMSIGFAKELSDRLEFQHGNDLMLAMFIGLSMYAWSLYVDGKVSEFKLTLELRDEALYYSGLLNQLWNNPVKKGECSLREEDTPTPGLVRLTEAEVRAIIESQRREIFGERKGDGSA